MTKLLLVDDEPSVLEFLEQLFGDAGYETITASDGVAGLREFFLLRPDLAIVDLMMPNMDGFELCRRIREISHIPLIVLPDWTRRAKRCRLSAPAPTIL